METRRNPQRLFHTRAGHEVPPTCPDLPAPAVGRSSLAPGAARICGALVTALHSLTFFPLKSEVYDPFPGAWTRSRTALPMEHSRRKAGLVSGRAWRGQQPPFPPSRSLSLGALSHPLRRPPILGLPWVESIANNQDGSGCALSFCL